MKNRCYNCRKALDPDRACMSDGDCEWFEEDDKPILTRFEQSLPPELVEFIGQHREEIERLLPRVRK